MNICHFTSAHDTADDRIFLKECQSLSEGGHDVWLVGKGESREDAGVHVVGCGEAGSRLKRLLFFSGTVYRRAKALDCDVYHFHDPELLPYGMKLKRAGKIVVFDSHEDVPGQILDKTWIPKPLRRAVSAAYRAFETYAARRIDAVVTATPYIGDQFTGRAKRVAVVNNYPKLNDVTLQTAPFAERPAQLCYAGSISENRGDAIMREAMQGVDGKLVVAGKHAAEIAGNVEYVGMLDRAGVNALYGASIGGLCVLKPIKNYYNSQPIKIYEYMAAGLPFICSDFPGWRRVAEESGAGICVDPQDTAAISAAIDRLLSDRASAQVMGSAGRAYVKANCTWENEEKTLLGLYAELEKENRS